MDESGATGKGIIKFDGYDVFGYLIPGTVLTAGIYVHMQLSSEAPHTTIASALLSPVSANLGSIAYAIVMTTSLLFGLYIAGHLVALFGAAILDKLVVERTQGFPYEQLFDTLNATWVTKYEQGRRDIYKLVFSIMIAALLWMGHAGPTVPNISIPFITIVLVLLGKAKYNRSNDRRWRLTDADPPDWLLAVLRKLALPFDQGMYLFVGMFMRRKKFRRKAQEQFGKAFYSTFDLKPEDVATDTFWLCYAYLCEHHPSVSKLIQGWLRLYGFARNLSVAFLLLYVYGLVRHTSVTNPDFSYTAWYSITGVLCLLFGARFYYIYYNYYSKFTFRAFIVAAGHESESERLGSPQPPLKEAAGS
ncbi:hypothetical protein [Anaerobaca lacustris]|uniref:Uncharacterized protein n=1 Tax=Anaerobaca lacustris TaxID=3044600 RepID=A0AAW6U1G0_9BACT|nr:hypothetical protein [Sedimentisphaerales bacterium M17dextr]